MVVSFQYAVGLVDRSDVGVVDWFVALGHLKTVVLVLGAAPAHSAVEERGLSRAGLGGDLRSSNFGLQVDQSILSSFDNFACFVESVNIADLFFFHALRRFEVIVFSFRASDAFRAIVERFVGRATGCWHGAGLALLCDVEERMPARFDIIVVLFEGLCVGDLLRGIASVVAQVVVGLVGAILAMLAVEHWLVFGALRGRQLTRIDVFVQIVQSISVHLRISLRGCQGVNVAD